ncbi:MAG: outer membrane protein assembly factor BamE [Deltaproteobacteria bacterium]|nr:outer membrane protein assembly factor BamE [Deltaproteobacteria bacterium]
MGRKLFYPLFIFLLFGCVPLGRDFPVTPVQSIQNNSTTQQEIFRQFGEPVRRGLENGFETWTYSYHYYQLGQLRDSRELHLVFNKNNTVRSYSFTTR